MRPGLNELKQFQHFVCINNLPDGTARLAALSSFMLQVALESTLINNLGFYFVVLLYVYFASVCSFVSQLAVKCLFENNKVLINEKTL